VDSDGGRINPSPRRMRRFGNVTRYVAMMLRTDAELTALDRVESVLRRWIKSGAQELERSPEDPTKWERSVVALASIGFARPDMIDQDPLFSHDWENHLRACLLRETASLELRSHYAADDEHDKVEALRQLLNALVSEQHLGLDWPPPADLVATYRRYLLPRKRSRRDELGRAVGNSCPKLTRLYEAVRDDARVEAWYANA
jgi:hypothetical protein